MAHTQAVLDASRKASLDMGVRVKIMELEIALDSAITIIEKKSDAFENLWQQSIIERLDTVKQLKKEVKAHARTKKFLANALTMLDKLSKKEGV